MSNAWVPIQGVQVIGITGRARHGKDELAKALLRNLTGAERFAFSDAVAAFARITQLMGPRDARVLQDVGTAMREVDGDTWLRCLYHAIEDKRPSIAIVTGIRYPNETALIREMGGKLLAVERTNAPALDDRNPLHPVEQQVSQVIASADRVIRINEFRDRDVMEAAFDEIAQVIIGDWISTPCHS